MKKLNKTKEKLFLMYENVTVYDLDELELYNFYKLFKVGVYGKMQEKLIKMLEKGKEQKSTFHFQNIVYREKCKLSYEKENSQDSSVNKNNLLLEDAEDSYDSIRLHFYFSEINSYIFKVPKNIPFILAVVKLYSKIYSIENSKIRDYKIDNKKIYLFDTIEENGITDGIVIKMKF